MIAVTREAVEVVSLRLLDSFIVLLARFRIEKAL